MKKQNRIESTFLLKELIDNINKEVTDFYNDFDSRVEKYSKYQSDRQDIANIIRCCHNGLIPFFKIYNADKDFFDKVVCQYNIINDKAALSFGINDNGVIKPIVGEEYEKAKALILSFFNGLPVMVWHQEEKVEYTYLYLFWKVLKYHIRLDTVDDYIFRYKEWFAKAFVVPKIVQKEIEFDENFKCNYIDPSREEDNTAYSWALDCLSCVDRYRNGERMEFYNEDDYCRAFTIINAKTFEYPGYMLKTLYFLLEMTKRSDSPITKGRKRFLFEHFEPRVQREAKHFYNIYKIDKNYDYVKDIILKKQRKLELEGEFTEISDNNMEYPEIKELIENDPENDSKVKKLTKATNKTELQQ